MEGHSPGWPGQQFPCYVEMDRYSCAYLLAHRYRPYRATAGRSSKSSTLTSSLPFVVVLSSTEHAACTSTNCLKCTTQPHYKHPKQWHFNHDLHLYPNFFLYLCNTVKNIFVLELPPDSQCLPPPFFLNLCTKLRSLWSQPNFQKSWVPTSKDGDILHLRRISN